VEISDSALFETILNYGDKEAFIELSKLMGFNKVAKIFYESVTKSERTKSNYSELSIHYFD